MQHGYSKAMRPPQLLKIRKHNNCGQKEGINLSDWFKWYFKGGIDKGQERWLTIKVFLKQKSYVALNAVYLYRSHQPNYYLLV